MQLKEQNERILKEMLDKTPAGRLPATESVDKGQHRNPHAPGAEQDGEFKNFGDFLQTAWHPNVKQYGTERLKILNEGQGDQGGFLVPEEFRAELMMNSVEMSIVRPRATVIPIGRETVSMPTVRDTTHASTVFGGVLAYWDPEGATMTASEPSFGQVNLTARSLTGYTIVSNRLMADSAIPLASVLTQMFGSAISYFEDDAFFTGTGAGQPIGILNANALISVAKETGQAANTIVWENIVKMFARMAPQSMQRAVWVANQDTIPQLATMSLSVGTGGSAVWAQNGAGALPTTILGRPVIYSEKCETLGTAGDLYFVDFSQYLVGDRQALEVSSSEHVRFTTNETAWRFIQRVDGKPWMDSALTPRNGSNTLSAFVNLAVRS